MTQRIEDYALIGDCETAALVGLNGSIDWLCWPRFDSPAAFAALLGSPENGCWRIRPAVPVLETTRRYRHHTLILETRFRTADGVLVVTDFMPPRGENSDVVRLVAAEGAPVPVRVDLTVRFGYGRDIPWVSRTDEGALRAIAGPDMIVLRTPARMQGEDLHSVCEFTAEPGHETPFVLTHGPSHQPLPRPIDPYAALADTEAFWREWTSKRTCAESEAMAAMPEHWREALERSFITLKALTYAPTGGIVAAPTTSLPEWIGGSRNWDYRFCWLRDASLTLSTLLNAGYLDEAAAWRDWLVRAMAGSPDQMQILYGLSGEHRTDEWVADWLTGFEGSKPVRIGNAAQEQVQLDVYGEVMNLLHEARMGGLPESDQGWAMQKGLLRRLEEVWRDPDEGIWEVRGARQHFTFSKLMIWVAFDRAIKSVEKFAMDDAPVDRWRALRATIHDDVCSKGFDAERNTFVQVYGGQELDASLLLIPLLGFLPPDDPRVAGTVEAVERELVSGGLVRRYRTEAASDGLDEPEGAFLACSFWLVTALALIGRTDDACALFERLLALRNDVGLLAEEYDPAGGRQLGNFPQAFSHVGLANAAHRLAAALAGPGKGPRQLERG